MSRSRPRVSEASGVVADLCQQTCRGKLAQPTEAGEDGHLRVLLKDKLGSLGQIIGRLVYEPLTEPPERGPPSALTGWPRVFPGL